MLGTFKQGPLTAVATNAAALASGRAHIGSGARGSRHSIAALRATQLTYSTEVLLRTRRLLDTLQTVFRPVQTSP